MELREIVEKLENESYETKVEYAKKAINNLRELFEINKINPEKVDNFFQGVSSLFFSGDYACNEATIKFYNEVSGERLWKSLAEAFCSKLFLSPQREQTMLSFINGKSIYSNVTVLGMAMMSSDGKLNFNERELMNDLLNKSIRPISVFEGEEQERFLTQVKEYEKELLMFCFQGLDLSNPQNIGYTLKQRIKAKASEIHQKINDVFHYDAFRVVERSLFNGPFSDLIEKYKQYSGK